MRKGTPSRRSSFARVSLPSTRKAPPVAWASPSQAFVRMPGPGSGATGSFFVAAVRVLAGFLAAAPERPAPAEVPRGRAGVRLVEAMGPRYPRGATPAGIDTRGRASGAPERAGQTGHPPTPPSVAATANGAAPVGSAVIAKTPSSSAGPQ